MPSAARQKNPSKHLVRGKSAFEIWFTSVRAKFPDFPWLSTKFPDFPEEKKFPDFPWCWEPWYQRYINVISNKWENTFGCCCCCCPFIPYASMSICSGIYMYTWTLHPRLKFMIYLSSYTLYIAERQTATRFGRTRGCGHVLGTPCILKC